MGRVVRAAEENVQGKILEEVKGGGQCDISFLFAQLQ
jgi:hypothetical protein